MTSTPDGETRFRVVVVGARRRRQGIGEFVARAFAEAGAEVSAVVGTSNETVDEARNTLRDRYDMRCRGYACLTTALASEQPDIVAVCSPFRFHREQLEAVADAGVHCLCEKPLWWADTGEQPGNRETRTRELVDAFVQRGRRVGLVTQWPFTLAAFYRLHPEQRCVPVRSFDMELAPTSSEPAAMVLDAVPHPLSMLQHLLGPGTVRRPHATRKDGRTTTLSLEFHYDHAGGSTEAACRFTTCAAAPRPAAYAINGFRVDRRIQLPEYAMFFEARGERVAVEDPLDLLVRDFLDKVATNADVDGWALTEGVTALEVLHRTAQQC